MSAKRFRIALSFAGETRDFVAKVAAILARRFTEAAILYELELTTGCRRLESA
ncbi:MAG TPA: hypothetical protein VNW71_04040 [Thermoanaerobaculia bacterium]|nr:hypothetical protein [Thermoanaerobaculia bacterium]